MWLERKNVKRKKYLFSNLRVTTTIPPETMAADNRMILLHPGEKMRKSGMTDVLLDSKHDLHDYYSAHCL